MSEARNQQTYDRVTSFLAERHIDFSVQQHEPFDGSAQAAEVSGVDPSDAMKSILLRSIATYALAVLPASERIDSRKMRTVLGTSSLRFATPEEVISVMECTPGTCHPFGLIDDIPTFVDQAMQLKPNWYFNAGLNTRTLSINYDDYVNVSGARIVDLIHQ